MTTSARDATRPSIAELRARCQPPTVTGRVDAEHWAGRLYLRRLSLHLTRRLVDTRVTPDTVTAFMIVAGLVAAFTASWAGLLAAAAAAALIQGQLLLDCVDGELARWRGTCSARGVYLDQIGHYWTEAALVAALGIRADQGWRSIDSWTTLGLLAAVLVLVVKSETSLVDTARLRSGLGRIQLEATAPRPAGLRSARRWLRHLPFYRALQAVELSLLVLLAATVDSARGDLDASRGLLVLIVLIGVVVAAGHLTSILTSRRLQ